MTTTFIKNFIPNAVHFVGNTTADYYISSITPTGVVNGKTFTVSFWHQWQAKIATQLDLLKTGAGDFATGQLEIRFWNTPNRIAIQFGQGSDFQLTSEGTFSNTEDGNWHHYMASGDGVAGVGNLYIDDVNYSNTGAFVTTNANRQFVNTWSFNERSVGGGQTMNLADFWFANTYIDLSVAANRRKFVSSKRLPVFLGANGEIPTGTSPWWYFGNPAASWATNLGTAGNPVAQESTAPTTATGPVSFVNTHGITTKTTTWASTVGPLSAALNDGPAYSNIAVRNWFSAGIIAANSTAVRVTFACPSSGGNLVLDRVYIGHAAGSGDAYDFDGTQVPVLFSGSGTVTLNQSGVDVVSDLTTYALDESKNFVVAFDVNPISGNNCNYTNTGNDSNERHYYRLNTAQASTTDATTGYATNAGAGSGTGTILGLKTIEYAAAVNNHVKVTS